jgi:hypothetical protein
MGKTRKLIGLVFCILIFAFININSSYAQLSPGDLAEPHSHLEGLSNCTECHTLGEKISNDKCLACHTHLNERIKQNKGFHVSVEVKDKSCVSCHSDHHGLKFDMINFKTSEFDHNLTAYELKGKHQELKCEECHKAEFISNKEIRNKKRTYLGLETACLTCHTDYHQETLSNDCAKCHDYNAFKPAPLFDHQKTNYPLKGKHQDVSCDKCHPISSQNNKEFQKFNGLEFKNCTACHEDVHENKFGSNCTECHNENSFTTILNKERFDHNQTNYPLQGAHIKVSCEKCHIGKVTDPLKHNNCTDCHQDYHKGDFTKNNMIKDCDNCHTINGFAGRTYTIENHQISSFPLKGAHEATPCFICHQKNDEWVFREIGSKCKDCHEDIHKDFISTKFYPDQNCESCHSEIRWSQIEFDHNTTKFELEGAHQKPSCRECHFHDSEEGKYIQRFSNLGTQCTDCHTDVHYGQFNEKYESCSSCHNLEKWKPTGFDHNKTRFALDGKHMNLDCKKCHETKTQSGNTYTYFKSDKIRCEDCH